MSTATTATLSQKDTEFRNFALHSNMWSVVFYVCTPLALYQSLAQIFKIFDSMMAAHISANSVSAVAYLSQINLMLSALGGGLAVGASIKVSEAYGAGDYDLVKKRVSTLFAMCGVLGIGLLAVLVPFTPQFLRFARTPEVFIAEGTRYFILELFAMVISFFNNVYIAIERARGNSKRILYLNMIVIALKLALTACFVYVLDGGINSIAVATIISQSALLVAAFVNLNQKGNAFGFSLSSISFRPRVTGPMLRLSFPVIIEKMAFSFGKVVVNSMCTLYGALTVGALGISNNIGGFSSNPQNGFQEGGSAIISQSLGAGEPKRALEAFKCVTICCTVIGGVIMVLSLVFLEQLCGLFAGSDAEFGQMIATIYRYEALGAIPLGLNAAVMALLYGFGKTRITLLINFSRVFVFRVPVLWFLQQFTDLGNASVGIVMAVSNVSIGITSLVIAIYEIRRICKEYKISFF
ncbi:MAG: MATE family efflux transporter [Eubacteriales bacterium]|nr:MATE family efflux transporter [Eubacteriales bacterium]